jgi:hypothetical protein
MPESNKRNSGCNASSVVSGAVAACRDTSWLPLRQPSCRPTRKKCAAAALHGRSAQVREPRRTIELVSFLQHTLFEHTDLLIRRLFARATPCTDSAVEFAVRGAGSRGQMTWLPTSL